MPLYVKKPIVVTAVRWDGTQASTKKVLELMGQTVDTKHYVSQEKFHDYCDIVAKEGIIIPTLEGNMTATIGDYIIKGVKGEAYPCKPDIFEMIYNEVNPDETD